MTHTPTKILYVITDLERGGVPLHLHRLACAVRDRGFLPQVVSLALPGEVGDMLQDDGIDVHTCGARSPWDLRVVLRLARLIEQHAPDIVHSVLFHANIAARFAALEARFPASRLLCELQTVEVERTWHLAVDRWTHRLCRCTIGNSPSVIGHLATHAHIPSNRLALVRGGIDPAPFQAAKPLDRGALGLPSDARVILWVGRLDPVKGLDNLITSVKQVAHLTPPVHLLIAGHGPEQHRLSEMVSASGLSTRVHLLGPRTDIPSLMKMADVFAFPSRTEGLPNALLEAMAAECAIVTTDVPGCRDLIEDGVTGRLVSYGDTSGLAGAIQELLDEPATARRLGDGAAASVGRRWSIAQTIDGYVEQYALARTHS